MDKFSKIIEEFCTTIFVVGLKELYQTKHRAVRSMWIVFILFSIVMTLFFMCTILSDYQSEPTSTKVFLDVKEEYPFPPVFVIIGKKGAFWRETGMSNDAIDYIQSWDIDRWNGKEKTNENETMYNIAKRDFNRFVIRLNLTTVSDLHSFAEQFVQDEITCSMCYNKITDENWFLYNGELTYEILFFAFNNSNSHSEHEHTLQIKNPNPNLRYILNVGRALGSLDDKQGKILETGYKVTVIMNMVQKLIRYPRKQLPCRSATIGRRATMCRHACNYEIIERCGKCKYVTNGDETFNSNPLCSMLKFDFYKCLTDMKEKLEECSKKCLPLCDRMTYHYQINEETQNSKKNESEIIVVRFLQTFVDSGILIYQEIPTYSFQSVVSNIGGQLGLWLGMGIITVIQMFMFCFEKCLDHKYQMKPKFTPSKGTPNS